MAAELHVDWLSSATIILLKTNAKYLFYLNSGNWEKICIWLHEGPNVFDITLND